MSSGNGLNHDFRADSSGFQFKTNIKIKKDHRCSS